MYTFPPTSKPPLTMIQFTSTGVLQASPGTLNGVEIESCSPGAQLWMLDSATGGTGNPLVPTTNCGLPLANGVTLNYGQAFKSGLSVLIVGQIVATAVIQE
jgi:hypothetical protein